MNSMKIGTYQMDTAFGLYLPEYAIPAPSLQSNFVKVVGRDGSVDLSSALGIHYDSRSWTLEFKHFDPTVNWHTLTSSVMNAIHGQRLNFEFDDDPNYYWTGRVTVASYVSSHGTGNMKITILSDPYKLSKTSKTVASSDGTASLNNQGSMPVVPTVTATAESTLTWTVQGQEYTYTMQAGTSVIPQLTLYPGTTVVTATAPVSFTWTEGSL